MGDSDFPTPPLSKAYLGAQTGVYAFGLALTALRMWVRRGRYWVDDVLALIGTLFCAVCMLCMWLMYLPNDTLADHAFLWLDLVVFVMNVWCTRASILVSVLRVATSVRFRKLILASLALFVVFWAASFAGKMWLCSVNFSLGCKSSRTYSYMLMSTDAISSMILVGLPLAMLWNVKLASLPRILILSIFAMGALNAAASILHDAFIVPDTSFTMITAHLQCALDLIACNLLVTVTFLFRVLRSDKGSYLYDATTPPGPGMAQIFGDSTLTTVDLDSAHFIETQEDYRHSRSTIAWNDAAWNDSSDGGLPRRSLGQCSSLS